jgi:hypothetical protein
MHRYLANTLFSTEQNKAGGNIIKPKRVDMNRKTLKELKDLAKQNDLKGYSKLNKPDLIQFIMRQLVKSTK